MNALDKPILGEMLRKKYEPAECYGFWEHYCKGFRTPCRDLETYDLSDKAKKGLESAVVQTLTRQRNRLLLKVTGWPRIGYLRGIFEDAVFVHVKRDPRSVANSLLNVDWWWGWRGPQNWRWGELSSNHQKLWEQYNRSFVALAGIECLIYRDVMESAKSHCAEGRFIEVAYEDLCEEPVEIYKKIVSHCDLEWHKEFESVILAARFRNTNYKWRQDLTEDQQKILEEVLSH